MLIGVVSRLTDQKGFDLVAYVMDELCQDNVQLMVLGTGEEQYENMFRHFAWKYPGKSIRPDPLFGSCIPQSLRFLRCLPDAFPV